MTSSPPNKLESSSSRKTGYNPDAYRMTVGQHLEELRMRLIFCLLGLLLTTIVCLIFGERVVAAFCRPLMLALQASKLSPQIYFPRVEDAFMTYIKISLITAAVLAGPWILYQLWQFVAAGLYPHERKTILKYVPLSITLLITGMVFLYFLVLPIMLKFFLMFSIGTPVKFNAPIDTATPTQAPLIIPAYAGDPPNPAPNQMWIDTTESRLKIYFENEVRGVPFVLPNLATPLITLPEYVDMVVKLLLSFGLAFQLPLVVLTLVRIGIVDVPTLKGMRRVVYFAMAIVAALIVPDVATGMLALIVPLILLFEMGLWLARPPKGAAAAT